jgi:hypothetical protein
MPRFLMMVYNEVDGPSGGPDPAVVEKMTRYNEELARAGTLLAADGLFPPSLASQVSFADEAPSVTDGPFAEAKEMVGGFWIMRAESLEEATAIAARAPLPSGRIEIRQIADISDYSEEVQQARGPVDLDLPEQTSA